MPSTEKLAATIANLVVPGMKPSDVIEAVRDVHGKVSRKRIARASIYAMIELVEKKPEVLRELYDFSLRQRTADD